MGYTTQFEGQFHLDKPLLKEHADYLKEFSKTRRMKRDVQIAEQMEDPVRISAGLPIGKDGEYFVGGLGFAGQRGDESIIDSNEPPDDQPGLWCQWIPNEEGDAIVWDGAEKFYNYIDWLSYIIGHFLKPWGYVLNGEVEYRGEDWSDRGVIIVMNNSLIAPGDPVPVEQEAEHVSDNQPLTRMKTFKYQTKGTVWHEEVFTVPEEMSLEEFLEKLESGDIYNVIEVDSECEYMYDTYESMTPEENDGFETEAVMDESGTEVWNNATVIGFVAEYEALNSPVSDSKPPGEEISAEQ